MKNKYLLSLLWVIVSGFGVLMAQEIAIIPQPAHLIVKNESFKFGKQLKVCIASYRGVHRLPEHVGSGRNRRNRVYGQNEFRVESSCK